MGNYHPEDTIILLTLQECFLVEYHGTLQKLLFLHSSNHLVVLILIGLEKKISTIDIHQKVNTVSLSLTHTHTHRTDTHTHTHTHTHTTVAIVTIVTIVHNVTQYRLILFSIQWSINNTDST